MNGKEQSQNVLGKLKSGKIVPFLPLLAFSVAFLLLYFLDAASFELMWKGRTFELFFIWLIALELILGYGSLPKSKVILASKTRLTLFAVSLALPTLYVTASFYGGLNSAITNISTQNNVQWATSMPLSIEYLAFALFFCVTLFLGFGKRGLTTFAIPAFFAALIGALYTIDNIFPYGQFTPFQIFVPTAASIAQAIFNLMGYTTNLDNSQTPTLQVSGAAGTAQFQIAWPCAGIESLLIFTVVVLLFLKRMHISWKAKLGFFAIGAIVTYFINIFRIVNIFLIGMKYGENSSQVQLFHFYYGPLISMTWIVAFPLILILGLMVWQKHKTAKTANMQNPKFGVSK
jgi:thaumarchaeosortase